MEQFENILVYISNKETFDEIKELLESYPNIPKISEDEVFNERFKDTNYLYYSAYTDCFFLGILDDEYSMITLDQFKQMLADKYAEDKQIILDKEFRTGAYPLPEVLKHLVKASKRLLEHHDYDGPDYEEIEASVKRAEQYIDLINNPKQ